MDSLFKNVGVKNKKLLNEESQVEETKEDKLQVLSHYKFSFGLDIETENFLKEQTYKLHKTTNKMYDELGKIFKETQERLAGHRNGCFVEWFEELGFKKDTVYRYIGRYNLIFALGENKRELIESLPIKLAYEISKETCPHDLKEKVLNGEIKTLQEFMDAKKLQISHIEEAVIIEEPKDYFSILESDFKEVNKTFKTLNNIFKEKAKELPEEKQKSLAEEMEAIRKKMEKLLKSL